MEEQRKEFMLTDDQEQKVDNAQAANDNARDHKGPAPREDEESQVRKLVGGPGFIGELHASCTSAMHRGSGRQECYQRLCANSIRPS